jgi:3-phosphoshikimate 1-carboxyvinyltransferase
MVMSAAVAAAAAKGNSTVTTAQAVAKSYPNFFEDFAKLGGKCE